LKGRTGRTKRQFDVAPRGGYHGGMDNKLSIAMRYWLLGRNMHLALGALEFGAKFHKGFRKDGKTPEYQHQLIIANYLRTFEHHLLNVEATLATAFLHDVCEDYDVGFEEIESKFGRSISTAVMLLTKKHRGEVIPPDIYYQKIAKDSRASIVKGVDRIHNIQSMVDVFDEKKQKEYIEETKTLVLPMLKSARREFTHQEGAYENLKFVLKNQIEMIEAIHRAKS